jgi:hypothetical protein
MFAALSAVTFASPDTNLLVPLPSLGLKAPSVTGTGTQAAAVGGAAAAVFGKPSIGVRVGLGNWNDLVADVGVDVTFSLPIIPLPAIRVDYEAWTETANFGDRHGNAASVLGIQNFALGYAGIGPSYYFSDDEGDHRSGFGAKLLVGLNLPSRAFVEASAIIGEAPVPVFVSIGKRF